MSGKSSRLFIALPVGHGDFPDTLKVIYHGLDRYGSILKKVEPVNLHITMKFLGEVDAHRCGKIIESFGSLQGSEKIRFTLKGIGAFPSAASPSVIWAGIDCDMKKITALFTRVEDLCSSLGFEREARRFTPHLTMARIRRGKDVPDGLKDFIRSSRDKIFGEAVFDRLVLFESKLDSKGPEYIIKSEVELI